MRTIFLYVVLLIFFSEISIGQTNSFDYFDQTPPLNTPEIFAPKVIPIDSSTEKSITISPAGDEVFFMRGNGWPHSKIMHMKKENGD